MLLNFHCVDFIELQLTIFTSFIAMTSVNSSDLNLHFHTSESLRSTMLQYFWAVQANLAVPGFVVVWLDFKN